MNIDEVINGWTFEETIKTAESLMEVEKNMFKWDVIRHLRDFAETYREQLKEYQQLEKQGKLIKIPLEAYCIVDFEVRKGFVLEETYHISRKPLLVVRYDDNSLKSHSGYLGISVFLTQSAAEAKLKELRGGEDESSN